MQRIERIINISQHEATVGGVHSTSTMTDGPSSKPHQSFAQLPLTAGAQTRVNLPNDQECGIERYNINSVPKNVDKNFTYNITTAPKK